jgi:hypothetical protein
MVPPSEPDTLSVLGQQPLPEKAIQRTTRFESFIQADTERLAESAETAAKTPAWGVSG